MAGPGLVGLALLLALLTFLPWGTWLGRARPEEAIAYAETVRAWLRWSALVLPAVALVGFFLGGPLGAWLEHARARLAGVSRRGFALSAAVVSLLATAWLSGALFRHNPHLVDTIAQLFQARIFAGGRLTAPAPPELEFFAASHLVRHAGRWFSQYPPGHPALLSLGLLIGAPWLVNPLFAAGTVLLLFAAARRLLGEGSARLAALLYIVSPFVLFMGASYMNHVTTGFFLALALYAALRATDHDGLRWPLLLGLALAAAATIRPLESLAWAGALGVWLLARRGPRSATAAAVACLVGLVPLFLYNGATTGHPLRFGYTLQWGAGHGLGFHTDPWGEPFTPAVSFANTALDFQRLDVLLFSWPFPSLLFVLVALAVARRRTGGVGGRSLLAGLLLAAPVAYFFYWHRDNYLGPRFLFASAIPAVLLTAAGIAALDERLDRWRPAFRLFLVLSVLYALGIEVPGRAGVIAGLEPEMKLHPEADAKREGLSDAVVFVKVGWGSRLVSRLWSWGVSASEAERTFRVVDGCRLQVALDEADSLAAVGRDSADVRRRLTQRLAVWRSADLPVKKGLLPDASVRVDTSRALADRCYQEVQRDRTGFTVYGPLVWRNDPWLRRGVVFARDFDEARDRRLMKHYRGRDAYLYAPLSPLRTAPPVLRRLELTPSRQATSTDAAAGRRTR